MRYVIFEDELASNFAPLTLTRPTFDLTLGTKTLLRNLTERLGLTAYTPIVRPHLAEITRQRHRRNVNPTQADDETLFINGLIRLDEQAVALLKQEEPFIALSGNQLALARLSQKDAGELLRSTAGIRGLKATGCPKRLELPEAALIRYPWQLVELNADAIRFQVDRLRSGEGPALEGCSVLGRRSGLRFEGGADVEPSVTFDVRRGPIVIGEGVEIRSFTRIEGPACIGREAQIRSAKIGGGTTIGDHCRIGGEIDHSIISSYSNKAHDGFIGHSYVGEWVNLGAGTSNSDLKNTYGTVRMDVDGVRIDTEQIKIGCFIADYAKTSIGCFVYTGRKIGVASHVHGSVSEDVPSFTIYTKHLKGKNFELRLDSAVTTQKRMMARRGVEQTEQDRDLLTAIFGMTQEERYRRGVLKTSFMI